MWRWWAALLCGVSLAGCVKLPAELRRELEPQPVGVVVGDSPQHAR